MKPISPVIDQDGHPIEQTFDEVPAYPTGGEYVPVAPVQQPQTEQVYAPPNARETVSTTTEQLNATPILEQVGSVPQSKTPEMYTNIERDTSKEGELAFRNVELGKATFAGGVTTQQLVSQVSGYYNVNQGLVADPSSGMLKKTANKGDPTNGTTWQATVLLKILQTLWKVLGR